MGFLKGVGPRRCPGCRGWFDLSEVKMVKIGARLYCPDCKSRLKPRVSSKRLSARSVAH
jgi:hypothetical protein